MAEQVDSAPISPLSTRSPATRLIQQQAGTGPCVDLEEGAVEELADGVLARDGLLRQQAQNAHLGAKRGHITGA
jgi:hypothetical protein